MHKRHSNQGTFKIITLIFVFILGSCASGPADFSGIDYTPRPDSDWTISTPQEQGLDPDLVARLYYKAARLKTTYGLLVFKNGTLIAEDYFHGGSPDQQVNIHSVTKSINAALTGIALDRGLISSLDQKMMDFFPELTDSIADPRKNEITIRQLLQMRAGYPWEESTQELFNLLFHGFRASTLVQVPLVRDPGSGFEYSNLTAHILGMITARASGEDLMSFGKEHLFGPLGIEPGYWQADWEGNCLGFSDLHLSVQDLARFGLLYLNNGVYNGAQIVPAEWVKESLTIYSRNAWPFRVGKNWGDNAYGFQWWSIKAGHYRYSLAWGHGGQQIALIPELNMAIVLTVDPLHLQHGSGPWKIERGNLNLIADFVVSLPAGPGVGK
ncbi:serine hydrolase [bacterium]|nr:serine hydrolase [bacterium]